MQSKFTAAKIISHIIFIIIAYAVSIFVCLYVPIVLSIIFFVPFNFLFQFLFLFIFDAVVYTFLNHMPFVRSSHSFLFIFLPTLALLISGIIIFYFNFPIDFIPNKEISQFTDSTNMKLLVVMLILPYITIFIGYTRHIVKCEKCGNSGICLMVRKERYVSNYNDNTYTTTNYGKIGEVRLKSSGEHVGDVYGEYTETEGSITEDRNYTTNYRCKCCGNFFSKNWTAEQITFLRKIKDKISGSDK